MKGIIKAITKPETKQKSVLMINEDESENWIKITSAAYAYAKKGPCDYEIDDKGVITKVRVGSGTDMSASSSAAVSQPTTQSSIERDKLIVRQSSLKCAVELCVAGKIDLAQVKEFAVTLEEWVWR